MSDFDWIEDVTPHYRFEHLEFKPHPISVNMRKEFEQNVVPNRIINSMLDWEWAKMHFKNDHWISVVMGTHMSNKEMGIYEVFSSILEEPVSMNVDEINQHMFDLQK